MRGQPLIVPARFVEATRDAGYRSTAAALAELVDNSIQAGATGVQIDIQHGPKGALPEIAVLDDGRGMTSGELAQCLRFGGSSRFNDRASLGRFGMGLPNASLSQARSVSVTSWKGKRAGRVRLDLDEVVKSDHDDHILVTSVPRASMPATKSGTLVVWERCDRLDKRQPAALDRHLRRGLGRTFRRFLEAGTQISLDARPIPAFDPIVRNVEQGLAAVPFGGPIDYEIATERGVGHVTVQFYELPVCEWHGVAVEEKRRAGVVGGAGVSVLRAGRELDFGWFLMGSKRKENYDDWWRAEIDFDPVLDELFGVTTQKQGIRPSRELVERVAPDLEAMARAMNSRVRDAFARLKGDEHLRRVCVRAAKAEVLLPDAVGLTVDGGIQYSLSVGRTQTPDAFEIRLRPGDIHVQLNEEHPLYRDVYGAAAAGSSLGEASRRLREALEMCLLAMARTLYRPGDPTPDVSGAAREFCARYSEIAATFLNAS